MLQRPTNQRVAKHESTRFSYVDRELGITTAIGAGFISAAQAAVSKQSSERVTLAMIGVGGRGSGLTKGFLDRPDVSIAYLCDPDPSQTAALSDVVKTKSGHEPKCVTDYRHVLDDKSVDAVVIAAPDHWHCPMAVFSCMAGKDVYVEKPLSYSIWEGRKAVEAARKYKRVMQVGMQSRSAGIHPTCASNTSGRQAWQDRVLSRLQSQIGRTIQAASRFGSAAGRRLRPLARPGAEACVQRWPVSQAMAQLLGLLGRRYGQRRRASDRRCPLVARQRLAEARQPAAAATMRSKTTTRRPTRKPPRLTSAIRRFTSSKSSMAVTCSRRIRRCRDGATIPVVAAVFDSH